MKPVVAVVGKGGVGKTTVTALLGTALAARGHRVLVVDADPASGLGLSVGLSPRRTLDDLRRELIAQVESGLATDATDMLATADYRLMQTLQERGSLALLGVGRPEEEGCYCKLNGFLRQAIEALSDQFAVTLIDAEAGVEQVNRRVMRSVSHLLLVCDLSRKALRVAESIHQVAVRSCSTTMQAGLVVNRARDHILREPHLPATSLPLWGTIREDDNVVQFDMQGRPLHEMPPDSPAVTDMDPLVQRVLELLR